MEGDDYPLGDVRNATITHLDVTQVTLQQLKELVWQRIETTPSLKQFENCPLNTFKLYYHAHGAKTNNPMLNLGGDERLVLTDYSKKLIDYGIVHETEISYFNWEDYQAYRLDPTQKW